MFFLKKERRFFFTLIAGFLILISSCQNNKSNNFEDFFYPLSEWEEGMVYEYQPVNNPDLPAEYWYFRKISIDSSNFLTGQYYDHNFTPRQIFNAEITENGTFTRDYILYEYDSLSHVTQKRAEIIANTGFPFGALDSLSISKLQLKWKNPTEEYPDGYLEMTRNRRFSSHAAYSFKNKSYECIDFEMKELVDDFNDGHLEKEFSGIERFAKNLGLIYYRKEIDKNFVLEYELRDTFSMKKLEQKFSNQ